jgi:hypothetical protein
MTLYLEKGLGITAVDVSWKRTPVVKGSGGCCIQVAHGNSYFSSF